MRALALVAEVVHGAPYRFADPARFSLAHGGKDRHPFPVPLKVYDQTIAVLKSAVVKARLGATTRSLRRSGGSTRRRGASSASATGPSAEALLAEERARSHDYGGRSVFGFEPPPERRSRGGLTPPRSGAARTMRLEPRLRPVGLGKEAARQRPEHRRMVHVDDMRDFVRGEIVEHVRRARG